MAEQNDEMGPREIYDDGQRRVVAMVPPVESAGGAPTQYMVLKKIEDGPDHVMGVLPFQPAPIPEVGVVGWTNEALLSVVKDRLECFQNGHFPCSENVHALDLVASALNMLELRTRRRIKRGV